jgi:hypothetical protein
MLTTCEPHRLQNQRRFPGDDSKWARSPSPAVQRKPAFAIGTMVENAVPCAFRHVRQ